jgi:hypothetical protein
LQKEAEYGQQQWEAWAGRYLAVLGSSILLPSGVTSDAIAKSDAADAPQFLSLTCHFDAKSTTSTSLLEMGLAGVQEAISMLPATVPFNVTIVSDMISSDFETRFRKSWGKFIQGVR